MTSSQPDVSIVLVSWNTRDLLMQCISSLGAALGALAADIWVVDNASSDDSVATVRDRFPAVRLIANAENVGFAAANNQAIVASTGRYVLLLNSDTIAHAGSIERLVRFADAHPDAGIVGPMLQNPDGSFQGSFADLPTLWSEFLSVSGIGSRVHGRWFPNYGPQRSAHNQRVGYIQGACMLVRRAAIAQVGWMDERYFMYSEEVDWCLRMHRAGWAVWYTPDATILHYGGQSTRQVRHAMVQALYRSKVRLFRKHYGPLRATLLHALLIVVRRCRWIAQHVRALRAAGQSIDPPLRWHDLDSAI